MKLWQFLIVRLLIGWVVVTVFPAFILFWQIILSNSVESTLTNSMMLNATALFVIVVLNTKLTNFPDQNAFYIISTVIFSIVSAMGGVIFVFRIDYSVYYFLLSMPLLVIFCFISQSMLQKTSLVSIGYVPIGRTKALIHIKDVQWIVLYTDTKLPNTLSAVVADLSDKTVQDKWAVRLASISVQGIPVYHFVQAQEMLTGRIAIKHLYENTLGSLTISPVYTFIKRLIDIVGVLLTVPVVLPIIILTCMAIKLESKGDVLFVQNRMGQGGKVFKMYKFRSMRTDAPAQNTMMTQANDSRITKVGKVIRKWRMDELPQFYNVLKGEMSLIGPRPELPSEVDRLEKEIPFYIYRQIVKPGISGWAQVMQGEGHVENIQTKIEYDFYYIKNISFTLDFLIVIKTIQTMLTGFGAR